MQQFTFLNWRVYKDSQNLFNEILKIVKEMPKEYRFELGSQMVRSSLSVVLNIAEGNGKESKKEFMRFLEIAFGSLYETLAASDVLRKNNLISISEFETVKERISSICNQLGGLKKSLRNKEATKTVKSW